MSILNPGYYNERDLSQYGFLNLGTNVLIAKDAIIIGQHNISLGSNIKIDSNVTLAASSGKLQIGNFVHIGGSSHFSCSGGVVVRDFVTISQGVKVYSASDDYSGESLTNPTVSEEFKMVDRKSVLISNHVIIGSNSVVLPGVNLGIGAAIGALSLVTGSIDSWSIYGGNPLRKIKPRSKKILEIEKYFLDSLKV
jgi:acetyltransferase-like isoleucine patch superfamily enzyme